MIAILVVVSGFFILFVSKIMKSSGAYKDAFAAVQADRSVMERFGSPIEEGFFVSGNVNTSGSTGQANISFPISGPDASGNVFCEATKAHGEWRFNYLVVKIKDSDERIVLVGEPAKQGGH